MLPSNPLARVRVPGKPNFIIIYKIEFGGWKNRLIIITKMNDTCCHSQNRRLINHSKKGST